LSQEQARRVSGEDSHQGSTLNGVRAGVNEAALPAVQQSRSDPGTQSLAPARENHDLTPARKAWPRRAKITI
jgi:hypothetical protein